MEPENPVSAVSAENLCGKQFRIPDLRPAFASWNQGLSPHYPQIKQVVDARLEGLIRNERVLAKVKAGDIGLFASGWFPTAPYRHLKTVALYCVWLFLWDDAIDGGAAPTTAGTGLAAEEYCRRSVGFVRYHLGLDEPGAPAPPAPTKVCGSFAEVGRRVCECCGAEDRRGLFEHLGEYMEACVTEYRWRLSGRAPGVDEFYGWRLRTSSVDVMLDFCRMLNGITLPKDVLEAKELAAMGLSVNKLLILINELFSLKKELKDGAFGNLIPITMRSLGLDLEAAVNNVVQDIHSCIRDFEDSSSALQTTATREHGQDVASQLRLLIEAYQAIATTVLKFSVQSPRYGLLKDRQEDGSFLVTL
ncbi:hypothetical protein VTI74DRAFT_3679 [Chaetomium olivicolor]